MRLFGVSMVRNEADIIEASLRHNLGVLDGIAVVDHGSRDRTPEILDRLCGEGLALRVLHDGGAGFFQAEWLTRLAREAFSREQADFIFPIDADEFLKVPSRAALERELAAVPRGEHAVAAWLTYVPEFFGDSAFGPSHLRRRLKVERHGSQKCVIGRSFAERPQQYIVSGNHLVDDPAMARAPRHMRLKPEAVALAHCPVRSAEQLRQKVTLGYAAHLATRPDNERQALHWKELRDELSATAPPGEARLRQIACNYGVAMEQWLPVDAVELVDDPVLPSFAPQPI
ncbi:MAG TPA: glycosyltransferase family 2 protein [Casimicrobiaceae bacterium]|nr:glycosyltransferase family 2 protein [Casimicrobiaceae bacterium]